MTAPAAGIATPMRVLRRDRGGWRIVLGPARVPCHMVGSFRAAVAIEPPTA